MILAFAEFVKGKGKGINAEAQSSRGKKVEPPRRGERQEMVGKILCVFAVPNQ
jgi:hypothetical protein